MTAAAIQNPRSNILLVEDNPNDSGLLEELLETESYRIALYCANDGYDALNFLHRRNEKYCNMPRPDVILLDLGLPRMNGYEVLTRIKKTPHLANIPVVVLTTSHDTSDRDICFSLGAQEFISKPYDLEGYEVMVDRLTHEILPRLMPMPPAQHTGH